MPQPQASPYKEIAGLFLKLGCIAFGGPAAHIAMMEEEVVHKRGWMTQQHYLDMVGATSLIPGPNSTEMAIHCGYHRGGLPGLLIAGLCFLLPATLITGLLAWFYLQYQAIPQVQSLLIGIKPAVIAIIAGALYRLGAKALKSWQLGVVGAFVVVASLWGANEVLVLFAGGFLGMAWLRLEARRNQTPSGADSSGSDSGSGGSAFGSSPLDASVSGSAGVSDAEDAQDTEATGEKSSPADADGAEDGHKRSSWLWPGWLMPLAWPFGATVATVASPGLWQLFLVFLKVGAVLFGSGYVLVAFLDGELVRSLGWLTKTQLLDAIAIGQLTPGPVLSTATFVGFQIKGVWGAVAATVGIFLPSFVFVAMLNPLIPKLRNSVVASAFLDAVNVCAVGLMLAVSIKLCMSSLIDPKSIAIFVGSMSYVIYKKGGGNALAIVLCSALAGYLLSWI